jgi:protein-arginine kinase activator protein McsA
VPGWAKVVGRDNDRVEDLRVRLEEAVAAERYEEAGRLRDEIRQLTPPETAV